MNQPVRILHVDDDAAVTRFVKDLLKRQGYEVAALNDPTLVMSELMRENYRIVILDHQMPILTGTDLLQQIKTYDGGIQVIMLTGVDNMTNVLRMMRKGALACCFKPIHDPTVLFSAVEQAHEVIHNWWATLEESRRRSQLENAPEAALAELAAV